MSTREFDVSNSNVSIETSGNLSRSAIDASNSSQSTLKLQNLRDDPAQRDVLSFNSRDAKRWTLPRVSNRGIFKSRSIRVSKTNVCLVTRRYRREISMFSRSTNPLKIRGNVLKRWKFGSNASGMEKCGSGGPKMMWTITVPELARNRYYFATFQRLPFPAKFSLDDISQRQSWTCNVPPTSLLVTFQF